VSGQAVGAAADPSDATTLGPSEAARSDEQRRFDVQRTGADGDRLAAELLRRPTVRAALLLPVLVVVGYAVSNGRIVDRGLFVSLSVLIGVISLVASVRPWDLVPLDPARARRWEVAWYVVSVVIGVTAVAPYLVVALDVEVEIFAGIFALALIIGVFVFPPRLRPWLLAWVVIVWLAIVWWDGLRDPAILALNLGGALLVIAATGRSSRILSRSLATEAAAHEAAEQRARLLASLLRTNTLDPDEVLRATADGFLDVGFDGAVIRTVEHERAVARLVEGAARFRLTLDGEVGLDQGEIRTVVETGRPSWLRDVHHDQARVGELPARELLTLPLMDGDTVHAVVEALTVEGVISDPMAELARLLASQAGAALVRARAYRADALAVAQLQHLEVRTQDFVSTVSHELRTPLTVVQGLGQTLLTRWDDIAPEQRQDLLDRIGSNTDRLSTMVNSLLDTSALESGQLQPQPSPVRLREAVEQLLHRSVVLADERSVDVLIDDDLTIEVDRGLFEHVLENLLMNTVVHTPSGTQVTIRGRRQYARAIVTVSDEGPGIATVDLPYVLDRFYRGGDPSQRSSGGLGLGLALAREVVEAHGGHLGVVSRVGEGTTFSFDVPLAGPSTGAASSSDPGSR
jgi:signal transduction histidine kinase